jgi:hypothetical protein
MRFALIATTAAAAAIIPFAVQASKPHMSGEQFVGAVRCAAYEMVVSPSADLSEARYSLNAEALRQPVAVAAEAQAVASDIAHRAVSGVGLEAEAQVCATAEAAATV